ERDRAHQNRGEHEALSSRRHRAQALHRRTLCRNPYTPTHCLDIGTTLGCAAMSRPTPRLALVLALVGVVLLLAAAPALAVDVRLQGTTDTPDSGLIQDVVKPGFEAMFPQYPLQYTAVGTGAALTNARNGQADAVLTHAPSLEQQFVNDGFSLEPTGRAIFYNDYVFIGHNADPANVLGTDPHNAIGAMQDV